MLLIELNSSFAVDEQVAEVARALGRAQRGAQGVDVLLLLRGVGHVEDEAGVVAVVLVRAAEQRSRLALQCRLHSGGGLRERCSVQGWQ